MGALGGHGTGRCCLKQVVRISSLRRWHLSGHLNASVLEEVVLVQERKGVEVLSQE